MTIELAIDFDAVRACRAADPVSSVMAAERAEKFARTHVGRILRALKTHGPMSPKQMFAFTGLSVVQCDRRRHEMINAKLVRLKKLDDGAIAMHEGCEVWEVI